MWELVDCCNVNLGRKVYEWGIIVENSIWEYLPLSVEKKKSLWENAVFVFDTNVLLSLYRYKLTTRETLLDAFNTYKEKIWIPYNVAHEYAIKRCEIIFTTNDVYTNLEAESCKFIKICKEQLRLKTDDVEINQIKDTITTWINEQKKKNLLVKNPSEDEILKKLLSLFENKVGKMYDSSKIKELEVKGIERYQKKVPPGYCDDKKEDNKYGDFIIWNQIMDYSLENKKDIIFVTDDQKDDWWEKCKGRTIGPRVELKEEFKEKTGRMFNIYSMEGFINYYSELQPIPPEKLKETIAEIASVQKRGENIKNVLKMDAYNCIDRMKINDYQIYSIENNMDKIKRKIERQKIALYGLSRKYSCKDDMPMSKIVEMHQIEKSLRNKIKLLDKLKDKKKK